MKRRLPTPFLPMVALLLAIGGGEASAQVVISDEIQPCAGCRVALSDGLVLGDAPGTALFDLSGVYSWRAPDGSFWVHSETVRDAIQILSADGSSFREFKRLGEGPGEFSDVESMMCSPDGSSLWIFDNEVARFARLSPDGDITTFPPVGLRINEFLVLSDSLVITNGRFRGPNDLGLEAIYFNPLTADRVGTVGEVTDLYNNLVEIHQGRRFALLSDGRIVSAHRLEYVIDILDPEDGKMLEVIRDAPWFMPLRDPNQPSRPALAVVVPLDSRFLLTSTLVPESDFLQKIRPEGDQQVDQWDLWDSVIEVIDLEDYSVVHRERRDDLIVGSVCPTGDLLARGPNETGLATLTVVSINLHRR